MTPKELAAAAIVTTAAVVTAATTHQIISDLRHDFFRVKEQLQPSQPDYPTVEIRERKK